MKSSLVMTILALMGAQATAATSASGCQILRQAVAKVVVKKDTWTQVNGIWTEKQEEVGRATQNALVIGDSMNGCTVNNLRLDNIILNGKPETIIVSSWIRKTSTATMKRFAASYWISAENGRQGWASGDTPDLSSEFMTVNMNTENPDSTTTAHQEMLTISVAFDDNAQ